MFISPDTIVAISSPAGAAGRAVVRLSGPRAIELAGSDFASRPTLAELGGFRAVEGVLALDGGLESPACAYLFRAPASFTREDLVELHIPGAAPLATALVEELIAKGARGAQPGEFTARAFFSGRIDLSSAQAVADVIDAASRSQLSAALWALQGQVARLCRQAGEELTEALASVEASIDLADEAIELDSPADLSARLGGLAGRLNDLAGRAGELPESADRPRVVLAGLPNVGKSSLLNALSGTDRAIVSAMAGTTRDVLSATAALREGALAELIDAAGLAQAPRGLEQSAQQAAQRAIARADAVVAVLDLSRATFEADLDLLDRLASLNEAAPLVIAANKADLVEPPGARLQAIAWAAGQRLGALGRAPAGILAVSALRGTGLDDLRELLADQLHLAPTRSGEAIGLHRRQRRCLEQAGAAIGRAAALLEAAPTVSDVAELVAVELRDALAQLGQITGQVVTDDVLASIFRRFCVGK